MYNTDENTGPKSSYFDAGIHENVKIVSIVAENSKKDGTGAEVLRFYFEGSKGELFNHTEFEVDPNHLRNMAKQWNADPDELIKNSVDDLMARVKHILAAFLPEDQIIIKANTWAAYCAAVVKLAGNLYVDRLFRVKLVYNAKDFVILPKKTFKAFIQSMEEDNSLKIDPKYDRVTPKAPSEEALYDDAGEDAGLVEEEYEDEF